jgi:hypothetical protein
MSGRRPRLTRRVQSAVGQDELSNELITLGNARAALYGERSASRTTGASTNGAAGPRRPRTSTSTRHQRTGAPRNRASAEVVAQALGKSLTEVVKPPLLSAGSRPGTPAKRAKASKAIDVLAADKLETVLQGEGEGLSAVTITERLLVILGVARPLVASASTAAGRRA